MVKSSIVEVILSLVSNNCHIQQIVINNAVLNGNLMKTLYVMQPQGFGYFG